MDKKLLLNRFIHNKTIVNGSLFSLFSFANRGINFLLLLVLAKYMMPDEYGSLSLFSTFVTLIGYFIAFCTENYLFVSYFKNNYTNFKKDFTSIFVIASINLILLCFLLIICNGIICEYLSLSFSQIGIGIVICYTVIFYHMLLDFMRIKEKVMIYGYLSCSFAGLSFVFSILLVAGLNYGWIGRVYAQLICSIIFFTIALLFFWSRGFFNFSISKSRIKKIITWGLPMIPHLGTTWIRQGGDRLIINEYYSLNEVGLFSFALNLSSIIIMIGGAFVNAYSVTIYKFLSDTSIINKRKKLDNLIQRIIILYTFTTIIIVITCFFSIPFMLPGYKGAIPYFLLLSIFAYIECVYFSISNILPYYNRNKDVMYVTFATSIIHLVCSFLLTKYSLYYTCLIYICVQLLIYYMIKKKVNYILRVNNIV